jgi:orotate phosphoribosyltransferase
VTTELRRQLIAIIKAKGLTHKPEPVQLASGAWSRDFIDGKEALAQWRDLELGAKAMVEALGKAGVTFDAAGGPTMGADALSVAIASVADCAWFFVRKEPKNRGTRRLIEGAQIGAGSRVVVVEDVITTGGSMLKAVDAIEETGASVVAAVTLVDRGEEAGPRFKERRIPYFPMATYRDLGIDAIS